VSKLVGICWGQGERFAYRISGFIREPSTHRRPKKTRYRRNSPLGCPWLPKFQYIGESRLGYSSRREHWPERTIRCISGHGRTILDLTIKHNKKVETSFFQDDKASS